LDTPEFFFTVCTAGHVDHGKTSVIRKLTGMDPDRLKEEKLRQMTTDLGFAHMNLKPPADFGREAVFKVGFIDVPGHGKFLKNMLAGVGCLDMALLVVAATEGTMPQTKQHAEILHLLGVKRVLVAITKIDLSSPEQKQESESAVTQLLDDLDLELLGMVGVSCLTDVGFENLTDNISKSLARIVQKRDQLAVARPLLLPVDRAFKKSGFGSVITGTLARGEIRQNDAIWVLPDKVRGRVRKLESYGQVVEFARPGQRVAVNVALKEEVKLQRGSIIAGGPMDDARNLLVSLKDPYAKLGERAPSLSAGTPVRLYYGTAEYQGSVGWCVPGEKPDDPSFAHIFTRQPFFGEPGDSVVIRESDDVIVGGTILGRLRPRWLTRPSAIELLMKLAKRDFEGAVEYLVSANRDKMVKRNVLNEFLPYDFRITVPEALMDKGKLIEVGEFVMPAIAFAEFEDKLIDQLDEMLRSIAETGEEMAVSLEKLRTAKFARIDHETFVRIVDRLESQGRLKREGEMLSSKRVVASTSQFSQSLLDEIEKCLNQSICVEINELAVQLKIKPEQLKAALKGLERQSKLRIVGQDFASSTQNLNSAHEVLAQIWQEKRQISPSEFKERLKITRKYAMPLLSFFDDELITRRVGEGRILLKTPKSN
jgi:selenocysteine-specific elongation factor